MISIIIPYYNTPEFYFAACINSIKNQNYKPDNLEIIIIDDYSSIRAYESVPFGELNYIIYHNNENKGPGISRQLGIEYASNDYVLFLDSDDVFVRNDVLKDYCDAIEQGYQHIYPKRVLNGLQNDAVDYHYIDDFDIWGKCYSKHFLMENNITFPEYVYNEDMCFCYLALFYNPTSYGIEEPVLRYVAPTGSLTDYSPSLFAIVSLFSVILLTDYFIEKGIEPSKIEKRIMRIMTFVHHVDPELYPHIINIGIFAGNAVSKYYPNLENNAIIIHSQNTFNYLYLCCQEAIERITTQENQPRVKYHLLQMMDIGNKMFLN